MIAVGVSTGEGSLAVVVARRVVVAGDHGGVGARARGAEAATHGLGVIPHHLRVVAAHCIPTNQRLKKKQRWR
jgi:hypothetical protein